MKRGHPPSVHEEESLGKAYDARLIGRLWQYVKPYGLLVTLSLLLMLAVSAVQLLQPYLIKVAIDNHIAEKRLEGLGLLALLFCAALVVEFLLRFWQLYVLERTGQSVVLDIRNRLFAHIQRLDSSFFDRNPVGRVMTRLTTDVEALNEAFTSGLIIIMADFVKLAGIIAILLWMDWRLALVTFAILPPTLALSWFFRGRVRKAWREVRRMVANLNAFLQENVSGMRVVQLFSRERSSMEQFENINRDHRNAQLQGVYYSSIFSAAVELLGSVTLAAIVWAGGWGILGGVITFGTLVAFIEYSAKFFGPVQELSQRYTIMQSAMAAAERIFTLLDTEPAIASPASPRMISGRLRGEIEFRNVTFGYRPEEPVLHDLSFRISPGESIAVVGWTGAGKTTLIRLLVRLYDLWEGEILLDGVNIKEYDLRDLRRAVGVVLQDQFLFTGTVGSNISLGDPAVSPDQVRRAAAVVHADPFIRELPGGYEEEVRERGSNFSVGQKQLLSFARAVAFDPAVLVLDEATASVDPETERRLREALRVLLRGRSSIIIAHRLATVAGVDRILVLHHGRLVEEGSHDELTKLEAGIYRKLYSLQMSRA
jgi:ATP-binding cassette subfamily B protein